MTNPLGCDSGKNAIHFSAISNLHIGVVILPPVKITGKDGVGIGRHFDLGCLIILTHLRLVIEIQFLTTGIQRHLGLLGHEFFQLDSSVFIGRRIQSQTIVDLPQGYRRISLISGFEVTGNFPQSPERTRLFLGFS